MEITAAAVLFEAHPHDTCGSIAPHYGEPRRAVDRPRLHPRGAPALRWAARLHAHDGVAAGDGPGGDPEHLVDADRRGSRGRPAVAPARRPLAGGAPAALGGDAQQLPRVGRDGRVRPARRSLAVTSTCRSRCAGASTRSASTRSRRSGDDRDRGLIADDDDPFGLTSFGVADVAGRPGEKWRKAEGRLASWVADMDFPIAPAIVERLASPGRRRRRLPDVGRHRPLTAAGSASPSGWRTRFGWSPDPARLHELADVLQGVSLAIHHLTAPGDGVVLHLPAYPPFLELIRDDGPSARRRAGGGNRRPASCGTTTSSTPASAGVRDGPARPACGSSAIPQNPTGRVFAAARAGGDRRARRQARSRRRQRRDPRRARPPRTRSRAVRDARRRGRGADDHRDVGVEGVQPRRPALGDPPRRPRPVPRRARRAAQRTTWARRTCSPSRRPTRRGPTATTGSPRCAVFSTTTAAAWRQLLGPPPSGRRYRDPEATYLAWLDCRALGLGDDPAATFRQRGVELAAGPRFGAIGAGFVRLNFATSPTVLEAIVRRMAGSGVE